MDLNEIKQKLVRIETMARPVKDDYTNNAVNGKLEILYKLSKKVPAGGVIVEIGSLFGSTAILMAIATKSSIKVHCVELKVRPELTENILEFGMSGKIAIWSGKSGDVVNFWSTPIDLLFIDGDHCYNGITNDSKTWTPFVKKGGVVVWHDYYNKLISQESGKAIDDFLDESKNFKVIMPETKEKIIRVARKIL